MVESLSVFEASKRIFEGSLWSPRTVQFVKLYADLLFRCGEVARSRQLWDEMSKNKGSKHWSFWVAMVEWEQSFGEIEPTIPSQRSLQRKGLAVDQHDQPGGGVIDSLKAKPFGYRNLDRVRSVY